MQISYYSSQERFMNWLCTKQKPYLKYQTLNDQLLTLKYQYYTNTSIDIRLQINNLENKLIKLLDEYFNQYENEETKSLDIEKLPRIDNDISQQTFIKRTKHKTSWGVNDKDDYPESNLVIDKFKINNQLYILQFIEDNTVELDRTHKKKKVNITKQSDGTLGVSIYKRKSKSKLVKKKYIILKTNNKSVIISNKINDVWKHETTNLIILKKILKFIGKYEL